VRSAHRLINSPIERIKHYRDGPGNWLLIEEKEGRVREKKRDGENEQPWRVSTLTAELTVDEQGVMTNE